MRLSSTSTAGVAARRDVRWRWDQYRTGMTQTSSIITMQALLYPPKRKEKERACGRPILRPVLKNIILFPYLSIINPNFVSFDSPNTRIVTTYILYILKTPKTYLY